MSKGYSSQTKLERLSAEFATIEPIRAEQNGLSVNAHVFAYEVALDAVEANSTVEQINATLHAARKGDIIRFTSGALSNTEVKVWDVSANVIELAEDLPSIPAAAVTFQILRPKYPIVNIDGELPIASAPIRFNLDGFEVEVTEDTVDPSNNIPLPVKLTSVTGDINITAGDLNVQLSDVGANYDATRIGDGTNRLAITALNEAKVAVTTELPAGTNNIGDVDVVSSVLPTGAATSALQTSSEAILTTIDADTGNIVTSVQLLDDTFGTDTVLAPTKGLVVGGHASGSGTQYNIVHVSNAGAMKVDNSDVTQPISAASLPLPTGAATEVTLASVDGKLNSLGQKTMAASVPVVISSDQSAVAVSGSLTVSSTDLDIRDLNSATDSVSAVQSGTWTVGLSAGTNNIGDVDVLSLPSIPAGTNNIGDVDVLTLPAIPAGSNTIGKVDVNTLDVIDFIDTTPVLDASVTTINGNAGAFVTLVASTAAATKKIQVLDTTGAFLGLYTGPAASEVLKVIVGPGSDQTIECAIAAGTRVSVRRLDSATNVTSGNLAVNFIG